MIRNVVVGRLPADADDRTRSRLNQALAGIASLRLPGMIDNQVGLDAGLREGGWSFAITNDWTTPVAYQGYDRDPEHNVYRGLIVSVCTDVARVQFEIPTPSTTTAP